MTLAAAEARWGAAVLVVVISALAVATVARPSHGYRAAMPLLEALAGGASGAGLTVGGLTVLAALRRRRRRPGTAASFQAPSYVVLGLSVGTVAFAVLVVSARPTGQVRVSDSSTRTAFSSTRTAFQSWQPQTVPLALRYAADVRILAALLSPQRPSASIATIRTRRAQGSLRRLMHAVVVQQQRFHRTAALAQLIPRFQEAIRLAVQASVLLRLAKKAGASRSATVTVRSEARRALIRSQGQMQAFVYQSNFLGMQLSAPRR